MNTKGANQYKDRFGLHYKTKLSALTVIIFILLALLYIEKTKPEVISPLPEVYAVEFPSENPEKLLPTTENIVSYIAEVFEPEGTKVVVQAIKCFYSESKLKTDAYNYNTNGTEDRGVAQINSIHGMKPEDAHNYRKNIEKAYQIYINNGHSFRPWYGKDCN